MKRIIAALFAAAIALGLLSGCGEQPCNVAGSVKVTAGHQYICADRHDGAGLRWYE